MTIKALKSEISEWKQCLYNSLCMIATERHEFQPRKRDSLYTLALSYLSWADEYNEGYFPEKEETDRYSLWLQQLYEEEFC